MPKIDIDAVPEESGSSYPSPMHEPVMKRLYKRLSDAGGLTQFGADLVTLQPGVWASQRHHHSAEDEFVFVLSGKPTLVDDNGETPLSPGDACTHAAGDRNGHHLVNNSDEDAVVLVVGLRNPHQDHCRYPDVDMDLPATGQPGRSFLHKDGTPFRPEDFQRD